MAGSSEHGALSDAAEIVANPFVQAYIVFQIEEGAAAGLVYLDAPFPKRLPELRRHKPQLLNGQPDILFKIQRIGDVEAVKAGHPLPAVQAPLIPSGKLPHRPGGADIVLGSRSA